MNNRMFVLCNGNTTNVYYANLKEIGRLSQRHWESSKLVFAETLTKVPIEIELSLTLRYPRIRVSTYKNGTREFSGSDIYLSNFIKNNIKIQCSTFWFNEQYYNEKIESKEQSNVYKEIGSKNVGLGRPLKPLNPLRYVVGVGPSISSSLKRLHGQETAKIRTLQELYVAGVDVHYNLYLYPVTLIEG